MSENVSVLAPKLAKEEYCYMTTRGRVSDRPHEIEIWFVVQKSTVYLMAGNPRSDWVLNLLKDPNVTVRIAEHMFAGLAHAAEDQADDSPVRYLMAEKYQEWENGRTLSEWARTALVVEIQLNALQPS